jgi:hypothetical protein
MVYILILVAAAVGVIVWVTISVWLEYEKANKGGQRKNIVWLHRIQLIVILAVDAALLVQIGILIYLWAKK